MGATDTTLPPYARQKPNGGTHANTFGSGPLNRRCCASFFDSAQDVCVYFWALPDTSYRGNESRGAAGRPGSDWTTGRSGAHAPGMAQGSSSWDYLQIQATQGVYVYFYWTNFPTCDHFSRPP